MASDCNIRQDSIQIMGQYNGETHLFMTNLNKYKKLILLKTRENFLLSEDKDNSAEERGILLKAREILFC